MIATTDLYWLAGILEGEGAFTLQKRTVPTIQVGMTDLDVMQRVHKLIGGVIHGKTIGSYKRMYRINICGRYAAAWMMTLYPLLGERRRTKIKELLLAWQL